MEAIFESLGIRTALIEPGRCVRELPVSPDLIQRLGVMHGGVISVLMDDVIGRAMNASLDMSRQVALTAHLSIDYLSPVTMGLLRVEGGIVRSGRTTAYGEASAWSITDVGAEPKLVARGSALLVLKPAGHGW